MFQGSLFLVGFILAIAIFVASMFALGKGRLGIRGFVLWFFWSASLAIFSFFPGLIDFVAHLLSVQVRGLFVMTIGLVGAYILVYSLYISQRSTERTVQRFCQEISLLRYKLEYNLSERDHANPSDHRHIK